MDDRTRALVSARRAVLALAPAERLDALLSAPRPRDLVRALPAQELYLTLLGAGLDRALPLLPLASRHQLDFLFDIDAWSAGELDTGRAGRWLEAFGRAGPELVARWLAEGDETTVVLVLARLVHVYKLDESTSEDRWPPDHALPTLDGIYFLEGRDGIPDEPLAALWSGLTLLRSRRRVAYEALLEQVLWMIPAEQEESAWTGRWSRLAERGFPDADESAEVRAAGADADPASRAGHVRSLLERAARHAGRDAEARDAATPADLPESVPGGTALGRAVTRLDPETRDDVAHQLVRLANRFAVADGGDLGDPATHAHALGEASLMASLGLEAAIADAPSGAETAERRDALAASLLATTPVAEIARLGVGCVEERAARARHLLVGGWIDRVRLARERLDPSIDETLAGLLLPRPRLLDHGQERAFAAPADLALADEALDTVEAFGDFLEERLGAAGDELPELEPLPAGRDAPEDVTWDAVVLTTLARIALGDPARPAPLSPAAASRAAALLLHGEPGGVTTLHRVASEQGLGPAAPHLEARLREDARALLEGAPDARFVRALLLAPEAS